MDRSNITIPMHPKTGYQSMQTIPSVVSNVPTVKCITKPSMGTRRSDQVGEQLLLTMFSGVLPPCNQELTDAGEVR